MHPELPAASTRQCLDTVWALITSNDFSRCGNYLADPNSNFVVVEIIFLKKKTIPFFLYVRVSIAYSVIVHVWLVFTHVLIILRMYGRGCRWKEKVKRSREDADEGEDERDEKSFLMS